MYRKTLLSLLLLFAAFAASAQRGLELRDVVQYRYYPERIYGVEPAADGETYTQISDDQRQIVRRSFRTGEQVGVLFDCATHGAKAGIRRVEGYVISPDGRTVLIETQHKGIYRHSFTAEYYVCNLQNGHVQPLSTGGPQQQPLFSTDGTMVAFVRDGNLFISKLLFDGAEVQVTTDGKFNEVINGLPDWVNEEEFTTARSFDFSADSKMLAWVRYDESQVPIYHMQMFKGLAPVHEENDEYPGSYDYKYPVAGADNSRVAVLSYDIASHAVRTLDVPLAEDDYVPRIKFTDDADRLAVVTLNRHQDRMDIYMVNPRSTVATLAVRETSDKYVKETAYESLQFFGDRMLFISSRTGHAHVYVYTLGGQLVRQATSGDFDVTELYGYDPKTESVYYAARATSPLRQEVYVADKKGRVTRLTPQDGTNEATFSANYRYFLNVYSSATVPPVTTLNEGAKTTATLADNAELSASLEGRVGTKEFFTFTTPQGVTLNGWMVKPRDFDPAKKYPVVMYQYSGPGSQEVTDSWNLGFYGGGLLESVWAQDGIIVACVDGRGTGGRGIAFEQSTYLNLGVQESEDQCHAARYLASLPYVDGARIAIWGWSFGGFNTLMSMAQGGFTFKCGVAVAAPSNWKYYDTIYTERYMRTPQENAAGYATNPISRAAALKGDLLLVHGTADDNVHVRNFYEMSEALVQAGIPFRQQVYTNRNHSIYGGNTRLHLFRTITDYWREKLVNR